MVSEFDRARAEAEQGGQVARQLGDSIREAKALSRVAWAALWQRDLEGAVANAQAAIRVAGPIGNDEVLARAYFTIGYVRSGTEPSRRPARRSGTPSIPDGRAGIRPIHHCLSPWPGNFRTGRGTTRGRRNSKPRPSSWRASTTT